VTYLLCILLFHTVICTNWVVVTGDNETGKTTLIAKLQGVDEPKKGSGLEFMYINVKDEYRDGKLVHCCELHLY
jgi:ABC-type transport system involved in cytochrome c biogenesis ATPase subunit